MEKIEIQKQKKYFVVLLALVLIFLLCFHYCGDATGDKIGGLVYGSVYDGEEITDETPLDSGGNKIVFPGFSTKVIKYSSSKQMTLQNPKSNSVDFVYTIFHQDEEVYRSSPIAPGKSEKWNLHDVFTEKGQYEITIHITPYDDAGAEKNGFKQNFTFKIV